MTNSLIQSDAFKKALGHPRGASWSIADDRALANAVAQIAIGQWRHLESILSVARTLQPSFPYVPSSAKELLIVAPGTDPWHRDGWVFQCISWIAAAETGAGPLRPPHAIWADKGFDGLQLVVGRRGRKLKQVLIFEDKATTSPRDTIKDKVWPEFEAMEKGDRDHELLSELTVLLNQTPKIDVRQAADRVFRENGLGYRLAITIADSHNSDRGLKRLFAGYEDVVPGRRKRRSGHVLYVPDLRPWLQSIADLALDEIDRIESV